MFQSCISMDGHWHVRNARFVFQSKHLKGQLVSIHQGPILVARRGIQDLSGQQDVPSVNFYTFQRQCLNEIAPNALSSRIVHESQHRRAV